MKVTYSHSVNKPLIGSLIFIYININTNTCTYTYSLYVLYTLSMMTFPLCHKPEFLGEPLAYRTMLNVMSLGVFMYTVPLPALCCVEIHVLCEFP